MLLAQTQRMATCVITAAQSQSPDPAEALQKTLEIPWLHYLGETQEIPPMMRFPLIAILRKV